MRETHDNDTTDKHPLICVPAPLLTKLSIPQRVPREINNLAKLAANDERMRIRKRTQRSAAEIEASVGKCARGQNSVARWAKCN